MTLKYLKYIPVVFLAVVVFGSCLRSDDYDYDESADAQIYNITMSSRVDSNLYLSETKFSIDQLNGKIFNRDSLPYLFDVDSIKLSISGKMANSFSDIEISLKDNDSTFTLDNDSISFKRLKSIKTTAADDQSLMKYDIEINIHQQDPYIISWAKMAENQVSYPFDMQKTISHNGRFLTYFEKDGILTALTSLSDDGAEWNPVVISGLPTNIVLSSIIAVPGDNAAIYILTDTGIVWRSSDGQLWEEVSIDYPVKALYGIMPMLDNDNEILILVETGDKLQFATTTNFDDIELRKHTSKDLSEDFPPSFPIEGFDVIRLERPSAYGAKYLILYGGIDTEGNKSDNLWMLQEDNGEITYAQPEPSISVQNASLFYYDNKVYLLAFDGEKNVFYMSSNFGVSWQLADENQALPEGFKVRKTTSVLTDDDNFIWIFGGKTDNNNNILDVWRGRLNKLAVD